MRIDPPQSANRPTTILGDWHANLLLWRPQLIHCINDRSLLSVLVPARESAVFPVRLQSALGTLLVRLGVPIEAVELEVGAMSEFVLAPTNNRSVLGCMRDSELALAYAIESGRFGTLEELEWHLTDHIHSSSDYRHPGELAAELLSRGGLR